MNKMLSAASAAAILLAAGSAFAQAPLTPGAPTPAPGFGIQRDGPAAAAPANPAEDVAIETIVAALEDTEAQIGALATIPASATIQVVDLAQYLEGDGAAVLTPALAAAEPHAEALRTAIEGNPTLMAQLQAENLAVDDVAGFGIEGTSVLVFVRPSTGNADANAGGAAAGPGGGGAPAAPAP